MNPLPMSSSDVSARPWAFVAGATGYTGRRVVEELRGRGIDVVAHVRPDSPALESWRQRFEAQGARVDATPWADELMCARLAEPGLRWVFALLGTTRARSRRQATSAVAETYEAVDFGLSAMLLRAAAAAPGRPTFVYLSAVGGAPGSRNAYLCVRGRMEELVRRSGLPYVIARPAIVSGPDRDEVRVGERLAAHITGAALAIARGVGARAWATRYETLSGQALARGLVAAALSSNREGGVVLDVAALRQA